MYMATETWAQQQDILVEVSMDWEDKQDSECNRVSGSYLLCSVCYCLNAIEVKVQLSGLSCVIRIKPIASMVVKQVWDISMFSRVVLGCYGPFFPWEGGGLRFLILQPLSCSCEEDEGSYRS